MRQVNPNARWRDSARSVKFIIWDASAVFPMLLWFLHMRWWTFEVSIAAICFFTLLNRYGFTVPVFLRWLRGLIVGCRKLAIPWWQN